MKRSAEKKKIEIKNMAGPPGVASKSPGLNGETIKI